MSDITVARRYAQALNEEARREQRMEAIDADMDLIRETLNGSRELVRLFESPVVSREKKGAIVEALFGQKLQPTTLRFLKLLIEKQRESLFPAVVRAYRSLRDAQLGVVEARARVPQPLSEAEEHKLVDALEALTGKQVRLETEQDPTLLGGLVVRVGDTVYDGSVRHQLANLREQLAQRVYAGNGEA